MLSEKRKNADESIEEIFQFNLRNYASIEVKSLFKSEIYDLLVDVSETS